MTDSEFQDNVEKVKNAFMQHKLAVMPHYRLPPVSDVFEKATAFILQHCSDPEMYVAAQFYRKSIADKMSMLPQFLYTAEAVENFGQLIDTISCIVPYDSVYKENKIRLNAHMQKGFSEEEILTSMSLIFDPCFRLTYSKEPIQKLMDNRELRQEARAQYNKEIGDVLTKYGHNHRRITSLITK